MTGKPAAATVGHVDAGNIVGNLENKYHSTNPVARWLMRGFLHAVTELYQSTRATRVLEVGCGEGYLADHLIRLTEPVEFIACDVACIPAPGLHPKIAWQSASIYDLPFGRARPGRTSPCAAEHPVGAGVALDERGPRPLCPGPGQHAWAHSTF